LVKKIRAAAFSPTKKKWDNNDKAKSFYKNIMKSSMNRTLLRWLIVSKGI